MRTLIAGGGTGGHLTPALAVAQALQLADPGGRVLLVSRRGGVAEDLVHAAGVELETIPISGLDLGDMRSAAGFAGRLPGGVLRSLRLIRQFGAEVVIGTAGYVSVPVVLAARIARVPIVLLEQNALPGRATRMLAGGADVVAASFAQTARHLPKVRVVQTGNPIRQEVLAVEPAPLGERCRSILVMGGSQGARRLNDAVLAGLRDLLDGDDEISVTHQTGPADLDRVRRFREVLPEPLRKRYTVEGFFADIAATEAAADLVVMRAGGSSLAEVAAVGRPMVLVPYPHAGGHQRFNAIPYANAGAAVCVADEEFSGLRFVAEVRRIAADPERWRRMAAASRGQARRDAASRVVELVMAAGRQRSQVGA